MENSTGTRQKALALNLDAKTYGTFAEIGAGQEVARWFFSVGGAAGTVAKTISAYDMAVSDALYGSTKRYVSRERLEAMLEHEFLQLRNGLEGVRGDGKCFFAFADTVTTGGYRHPGPGRGWLGVRFQTRPHEEPSEVILHAHLRDSTAARQHEALGVLGVNLIHGAFYRRQDPADLIAALLDELSRERVEIDMIKFSGPAFPGIDNRLMSLQLVERALTDAAMFTAGGEVVQPSEVLHKKPILVERGSFRPATKLTLDLLNRAREQFLYVYPTRDPVTGEIQSLEWAPVPPPWHHLRALLLEIGRIEPIRGYDESCLSIRTPDVLARIQGGDASWERMVPAAVAEIIKAENLFGWRPGPATSTT